jgi:hypothetical protein
MARISRMIIAGEQAVYHVMSRTALDGFPFGDAEREYLLSLKNRKRISGIPLDTMSRPIIWIVFFPLISA